MPAKSKAQQKFMGMVRAAQQGEKAASVMVAKVAKKMKKKDVEDYAHIIMEYGNGVIGWIDSSWSRHNHRMLETQIHIEGDLGTLSINDDRILLYLTRDSRKYKKGWTEINKMQLPMGASIDLGAPA